MYVRIFACSYCWLASHLEFSFRDKLVYDLFDPEQILSLTERDALRHSLHVAAILIVEVDQVLLLLFAAGIFFLPLLHFFLCHLLIHGAIVLVQFIEGLALQVAQPIVSRDDTRFWDRTHLVMHKQTRTSLFALAPWMQFLDSLAGERPNMHMSRVKSHRHRSVAFSRQGEPPWHAEVAEICLWPVVGRAKVSQGLCSYFCDPAFFWILTSGSSGCLSGWQARAIRWYAFLISDTLALGSTFTAKHISPVSSRRTSRWRAQKHVAWKLSERM